MDTRHKRFLRVVSGCLGVAGVASVTLHTLLSFSPFTPWSLALAAMGAPGAALFLWFAFHRDAQAFRHETQAVMLRGPADGGGFASAPVTWPKPVRPPSRSAAAAQAIPVAPKPFEYLHPPEI